MFMLTPPSAFACKLRLLFKNSVSAKCICFNIWGKKYQGQIQSFNFSLIFRSGNMILAEWAQTQWQNGLHIFKKAQHLGESRLLFWKPGISKLGEIMQFNHSDYLQYAACYAILIPALWLLPQLSFCYLRFPLDFLWKCGYLFLFSLHLVRAHKTAWQAKIWNTLTHSNAAEPEKSKLTQFGSCLPSPGFLVLHTNILLSAWN